MKVSEKKLLFLEVFMILMLIINIFFLQTNIYIISLFIIVMFFGSALVLGYESDRHRFKKDGILLSIIFAIVFEILVYLFGLYVGFLRSGYSITVMGIIQNITPFILVVVTGEILRYEFMTKGEKKMIFFFLTLIAFILLDTSIGMYRYNINSSRVVVEVVCLVFIPSITKNILLTYWVKKFGVTANITYLLITTLVTFIIPILPNLNKYLEAIIALVYPAIVYFISKKILKETVNYDKRKSKKFNKILGGILFVFMLILIALTSGVFKYYFLTIGSGSMQKTLYVGDVIIVKKLDAKELNEIDVGTIIVFKMENKVVVHRVVEIKKDNGLLLFYTKGDNNKERDNWVVTENNLIGTTKHKIPVIGLPSVWLYEFVEGSKVE
jgi:signal peptidase